MSQDYFFATSLSGTEKEYLWEPDALKENGDGNGAGGDLTLSVKGEHSLILKQAVLGHDAKDEVHVLEVETLGYRGKTLKVPVCLLNKSIGNVLLDLNFPDPPVTVRLIQGSGPVHISGNHVINQEQFLEDEEDEDDDIDEIEDEDIEAEDDEEEEKEKKVPETKTKAEGSKKRAAPIAQPAQAKKKKKNDA